MVDGENNGGFILSHFHWSTNEAYTVIHTHMHTYIHTTDTLIIAIGENVMQWFLPK